MLQQRPKHKKKRRSSPGNPTSHITRLAGDEEGPAALLLAVLGQPLEVKQLPDGTAPAGEQDLVYVPVLLGGPALEAGLVAGHGAKVFPDPAQHVLGLLDAAKRVRQARARRLDLVGGLGGQRRRPPGPDQQHVAEAGRGAVLERQAVEHVAQRDGRGGEVVKGLVGGGAPGFKVDQDRAPDYPLVGPGVDAVGGGGSAVRGAAVDVFHGDAVVEELFLLLVVEDAGMFA